MAEVLLSLPTGSEVEIDSSDHEVEVENLGVVVAHANKGASRLIERFQRAVYLAVLRAVAEEIQLAENMLWEVLISKYVDEASGVSLNFIGNRVGEPRRGADDPYYRVRIKARIHINRSRGGPEDVLELIRLLGGVGQIWNTGNASMRVDLAEPLTSAASRVELPDLLGETVSGGVRIHVDQPTSATPFRLGDAFTDTDFGGILQDAVAGEVAGAGLLTDGRAR